MFTKYGYVELPSATFYPNGGVNRYYKNIYAYPVSKTGEAGCATNVYYDDICPVEVCPASYHQPNQSFNNTIKNCNNYYDFERPIAVAKPKVVYIESEYDNAKGHPVTSVNVPTQSPFNIYQGTGIGFDLLAEGIKISNKGVITINISGESGSGLTAVNIGTEQHPNYKLSFNPSELINKAGAVQKIVFNGKTYEAFQGVIAISGGSPSISSIQSPNNTISVAPLSIGILGISVRPLKVNGTDVSVGGSGNLANFIDGENTTIVNTSGNNIAVNVANNAFVKSILGQTPNITGDIDLVSSRQACKDLNATEVSAIKSSGGLDLLSLAPITGSTTPEIKNSDNVMLFINDRFVPINKYVRTNSLISNLSTSVSLSAGDTLTWIVTKST